MRNKAPALAVLVIFALGIATGAEMATALADVPVTDPSAIASADRAYIQSLKEYQLLLKIYGEQLRANQHLPGDDKLDGLPAQDCRP